MPKIILIAAVSLNNVIGDGGRLLWHIPEDFQHFKNTTMGGTVIMGRKTFDSLGRKALRGRTNIVVQRAIPDDMDPVTYCTNPTRVTDSVSPTTCIACCPDSNGEKVIFTNSIENALTAAQSLEEDIYIIGGGEIYRQTIDVADELIISHIAAQVNGETVFPSIDLTKWGVREIDHHRESTIPFSIIHYTRIA